MTINFYKLSANVIISLRSANARVFLKNSRHCDNRNVYNYHEVIIIAFADEIIDIANNLIAMIDKNHLQMLEFFKL